MPDPEHGRLPGTAADPQRFRLPDLSRRVIQRSGVTLSAAASPSAAGLATSLEDWTLTHLIRI